MLRRWLAAEGDLPPGLQEKLAKAKGKLTKERASMLRRWLAAEGDLPLGLQEKLTKAKEKLQHRCEN